MLRGNLIDKKILESKPVESILSGVVSIALGSLLLVGTVKVCQYLKVKFISAFYLSTLNTYFSK